MADIFLGQTPAYNDIFNQIQAVQRPGGYWTPEVTNNTIQGQAQQFASLYKNMTGQDPTPDVMNSFYQNIGEGILNSPGGEYGANYASNQALDTPYIQNTYGPQIQDYQKQQQNQNLAGAQQTAQTSINQMNKNTQDYLMSPQSQASIQGNLNNSGMLNSGAYDQTLAGLMSQGALQNENSAIQGLTIPAEQNLLGTLAQPYANQMSGSQSGLTGFGTQQNNIQDFNMQSTLAQLLANEAQPSGTQNALGMATGAAGGAGNLLSGASNAYKATYICTEMVKKGVLAKFEVKRLHDHLFKAFWRRPFKFIGYFIFGKLSVWSGNLLKIDWMDWKPIFYEKVINENDPAKAIDLYALAFWSLVKEIRHRIRIKMLIIYDNPLEGKN